jgi:hypothetical protein
MAAVSKVADLLPFLEEKAYSQGEHMLPKQKNLHLLSFLAF